MFISKIVQSNDRTKKIFFNTADNETVEACLLFLEKHGAIICVSSQIGCSQNCRFCAAGLKSFSRNLSSDEIASQASLIIPEFPDFFMDGFQITYMGSGEPLMNYENVDLSARMLFEKYPNLTKINLSTMLPFLDDQLIDLDYYKNRFHLQFSLHFTTAEKRETYFNSKLPSISDSLQFINHMARKLNDVAAVNYMLIDGVNDSVIDADRLAGLVHLSNVYLKISSLCSVNHSKFRKSNNIIPFIRRLSELGIKYDLFDSSGTDINAGCGQFYNESIV